MWSFTRGDGYCSRGIFSGPAYAGILWPVSRNYCSRPQYFTQGKRLVACGLRLKLLESPKSVCKLAQIIYMSLLLLYLKQLICLALPCRNPGVPLIQNVSVQVSDSLLISR